jgi:ubiquinone/menaquinone biosynthesis C-methylase UbiE
LKQTYQFDSFGEQTKKSEISRLTANVESHSKALLDIFLNNGLLESRKILDVGCGTGEMTRMFSSILPESEFYGIDSSIEILQGTSILEPNITLKHGFAHQLPFEDNSFDFVYTRLVLMHNPDPELIIGEMKRVCKPNGVIIAVEIDDGTMVFHPHAEEFSHLVRAHIEYDRGNGTDRIIGRKLFGFFKNQEIENVKVIIQTSDYEGAYDDIPFSLRLGMGNDEGKHLVERDLITEEERLKLLWQIPDFCNRPDRYYSGSFMYCVGNK